MFSVGKFSIYVSVDQHVASININPSDFEYFGGTEAVEIFLHKQTKSCKMITEPKTGMFY